MTVVQTSDDRFDHPLGLSGASNWNGNDTCLFSRVVVSSHKQGISYVNHLFHRNAESVLQLLDPVGFVDARLGDINGCRATEPHRELGNQCVEDCFDLLPLGEIRIPFLFLF